MLATRGAGSEVMRQIESDVRSAIPPGYVPGLLCAVSVDQASVADWRFVVQVDPADRVDALSSAPPGICGIGQPV